MQAKQRGFTLLEVLLAGFILFLVLSSMALVYRGAMLGSGKAERSLLMSAAILPIRSLITEHLRKKASIENDNGAGRYADMDYRWVATLNAIGRPSAIIEEDAGIEVRYFLWDIEVIVSRGNVRRNFRFREISW